MSTLVDFRAIIRDRMQALGISPGALAAKIAPRWITARSPNGLDARTAEESLCHWLAGRRPIPISALEVALDVLDLDVVPRMRAAE